MRAGNKDQMLILEIISRMQELQVSSLCSARTRAVDWRTQHRTGLIWLQVHHVSLTIPSPPPYLLPGTGFLPNLSSQHNLSSEHKSGNQCNISGWRRWQSLPVFLLSRTPVTPDTPCPPRAHPSDHTTVTSSSGTSWRTSTAPPLSPWSLPFTRSVCLVLQWVKPRTFPSRTSFRRISLSRYFALILMIFKRSERYYWGDIIRLFYLNINRRRNPTGKTAQTTWKLWQIWCSI